MECFFLMSWPAVALFGVFSAYMKKLTSQSEERYKYRRVESRAFQRSCVSIQKPALSPTSPPSSQHSCVSQSPARHQKACMLLLQQADSGV